MIHLGPAHAVPLIHHGPAHAAGPHSGRRTGGGPSGPFTTGAMR